ncbi:MAG: glycosyltransferase [Anaerotruncus sp.]|nr:glycosyltransferase [Anaerotruncus sp.]
MFRAGRNLLEKSIWSVGEKCSLFSPRRDQAEHNQHGSSDGLLRIVTCSYIVPLKRLELFVSSLMKVSRKVIWTHIGDGQDKGKIFELSTKLPNNIQSNFLGHLENKDVLDYYQNNPVDLFVNVSSYEGVPVSIMEALSFGIEPVATDKGVYLNWLNQILGHFCILTSDLSNWLTSYKNIKIQKSVESRRKSINKEIFHLKTINLLHRNFWQVLKENENKFKKDI